MSLGILYCKMPIARIWELLSLKYNNEISPEQLAELGQLLQENQDVLQVNEFLSALHELPIYSQFSAADEDRNRRIIEAGLQAEAPADVVPIRRRSPAPRVWLVAALALIVASVAILWGARWQRRPAEASPLSEVVASGGSKTKVILPDGSSIILNTGSRISYNKDFGVHDRQISLNGEAFFDIAKNENIPLTVHAGNVTILVMGTAFNVRAYAEDSIVETSLIRGLIEVWSNTDSIRKVLLRPREKIIIGKTTRVTSDDKDKPVHKEERDIFSLDKIKTNAADSSITEIAWTRDKLVFQREAFLSLSKKMERWYNVKIIFSDPAMAQLEFTGSFEKETLVEALEALRQTEDFNYTIENRTVTITKN